MESKGRRGMRAPEAAESPAETAESMPAPPPGPPDQPIRGEALPPAAMSAMPGGDFRDFSVDSLAALAEAQAAVMRDLDALSAEVAGVVRLGIAAAAQSAQDMLAVRTLADAVEVTAGLARRSFETLAAGSTRLSEAGVRLASDAAEPILFRLGCNWLKAVRLGG